jgi:uncharacterized protein YndB with AHSA1/START domain
MNHSLSVSASIQVNAPASKVWEALTNPEIIKQYLFGTETITDWKVGSDIVFQGEYNGVTYKDKGTVQQNIPDELLSYLYWSSFMGIEDTPDNYSLVTCAIKSIDANHSEFTWTQKGFANEESHKHSESGTEEFLKGMKTIIEQL